MDTSIKSEATVEQVVAAVRCMKYAATGVWNSTEAKPYLCRHYADLISERTYELAESGIKQDDANTQALAEFLIEYLDIK